MKNDDLSLKGGFGFIFRGATTPPVAFPFLVQPQSMQVEFPARGAIHQTLGSNFLDDFSGPRSILASVRLRGTFGYKVHGIHGSITLKALEVMYEAWNGLSRDLKARTQMRQEFVGLGRLYFWRVWIDRFQYGISKDDPLLYYYDLHFFRLDDYLAPVTVAQRVGNLVATTSRTLGAAFGSLAA